MSADDLDPVALRRILWRCRRGTRELDILLSGFAESRYGELGAKERAAFESLLTVQDPVLNDWLANDVPADAEYRRVVALVIAYKQAR